MSKVARTGKLGALRVPHIFYGWWIVAGGFFGSMVANGLGNFAISAIILPLEREFGWSRSAITGAISLSRVESGVLGPLGGWMTDRFGVRVMMAAGAILLAGGFFALAHVHSLPMFYVVFVGGIVVGSSVGFSTPASTAVANWFDRKRGMALGLTWAGHGTGGVLVVLIGWLVAVHGWRTAANVAGVLSLGAGLPIALMMRHRPEDMGLHPDGVPPEESGRRALEKTGVSRLRQAAEAERTGEEYSAGRALRTRAFWAIGLSSAARQMATSGVTVHFIPLLAGPFSPIGTSEPLAAGLFALTSMASNVGRVALPWAADFVSKRLLMTWSLLALAVSVVVMGVSTSLATFIPAALVFGVAWGAMAVLPQILRADYFGRTAFATIRGWNQLVQMIGVFGGPILAAFIYDRTHSYVLSFVLFAFAAVVGVAFNLLAKPPERSTPSLA